MTREKAEQFSVGRVAIRRRQTSSAQEAEGRNTRTPANRRVISLECRRAVQSSGRAIEILAALPGLVHYRGPPSALHPTSSPSSDLLAFTRRQFNPGARPCLRRAENEREERTKTKKKKGKHWSRHRRRLFFLLLPSFLPARRRTTAHPFFVFRNALLSAAPSRSNYLETLWLSSFFSRDSGQSELPFDSLFSLLAPVCARAARGRATQLRDGRIALFQSGRRCHFLCNSPLSPLLPRPRAACRHPHICPISLLLSLLLLLQRIRLCDKSTLTSKEKRRLGFGKGGQTHTYRPSRFPLFDLS